MQQLDYYANLLTLRKIDRREFMGRALALGATTALATSMASKALQAATKRKGGSVRYATPLHGPDDQDRKSTRLNSSHVVISYAVVCLQKKKSIRVTYGIYRAHD